MASRLVESATLVRAAAPITVPKNGLRSTYSQLGARVGLSCSSVMLWTEGGCAVPSALPAFSLQPCGPVARRHDRRARSSLDSNRRVTPRPRNATAREALPRPRTPPEPPGGTMANARKKYTPVASKIRAKCVQPQGRYSILITQRALISVSFHAHFAARTQILANCCPSSVHRSLAH